MDRQLPAVPNRTPSRALAIVRRIAGPIWRRAGATVVLEVPGRRSGALRRVTLLPLEADGKRYLISQYGSCDWVRNLRAAGRGVIRFKGDVETFTPVEVDGPERDRVIAVLRANVPKPFRVDFEKLPFAADHPAFRIEPAI